MTAPMPLFPSQQSERIWRQQWCDRCWRTQEHGPGCAILDQLIGGVLPAELRPATRKVRTAAKLYRCEAFSTKPPAYKAPKAPTGGTQPSMFDDEPEPVDSAIVDAARSITGLPREAFGRKRGRGVT